MHPYIKGLSINVLYFFSSFLVVHGAVTDLKFNGESFIRYIIPKVDGKSQNSDSEGISLIFKTTKAGGIPLFFAHSTETSSFQFITLEEEFIKVQYKFSRQASDVSPVKSLAYSGKFADGKWHTLIVRRMVTPAVLSVVVDNGKRYLKSLEGYMKRFRKLDEVYIGKVQLSQGFVGSMRQAQFQPSFLSQPIELVKLALEYSSQVLAVNFTREEEEIPVQENPFDVIITPVSLHAKYEKEEVHFVCSVQTNASKVTKIEWRKNNTSVFKPGHLSPTYSVSLSDDPEDNQKNSTLTIKALIMAHDGVYECVITASNNNTYSVFTTLIVHGEPDPPQDLQASALQTKISMTWKAPLNYGASTIKGYNIYYQGCYSSTVCEDKKIFYAESRETTDAVLANLKANIQYTIEATALNDQGESSRTAPVTAKTMKAAPGSPPEIISVTSPEYGTITVVWKSPDPRSVNSDVYWYELYIFHADSSFFRTVKITDTKQTSHSITGLQAWSPYVIKLLTINEIGKSEASTKRVRTKETVPSMPPTLLSIYPSSSTSLQISWQIPETHTWNSEKLDAVLIHYNDEHNIVKTGILRTELDDDASSEIQLYGLQPMTQYSVFLTVLNIAGESARSKALIARTFMSAPTDSPSIINVTALDSKSLEIFWKVPDQTLPRHYVVEWFTIHYKIRNEEQEHEITSEKTSIQLTGLVEFTEYAVTVSASNSKGNGPKSSISYKRTSEGVPSMSPSSISVGPVGSTQLDVEWQPISSGYVHGKLLGYRIAYGVTEQPIDRFIFVNSTLESEISIKDLLPDTIYFVKIAGFTRAGIGAESTEMEVRTNPRGSTSPRDFKATAISSTIIQLIWKIPSQPNGRIKYYIITVSESKEHLDPFNRDKAEYQTASFTDEHTMFSFNYTRRKIFTRYYFSLRAFTGVQGEEATASAKTLQGASSQPSNVSLKYLSSTSMMIHWGPPSTPNGIITHYKVFLYEEKTGKDTKRLVPLDVGMFITFNDLIASEFYTVKICAVTIKDGDPFVLTIATHPENHDGYEEPIKGVKISTQGSYPQINILFVALIALVVIISILIAVCLICFFCKRKRKNTHEDNNHNLRVDIQRSHDEIEMEYRMDSNFHSEDEFERVYDEIPQMDDEEDEEQDEENGLDGTSPGVQTWDSGFPDGMDRDTSNSIESESSIEIQKYFSSEERANGYIEVDTN